MHSNSDRYNYLHNNNYHIIVLFVSYNNNIACNLIRYTGSSPQLNRGIRPSLGYNLYTVRSALVASRVSQLCLYRGTCSCNNLTPRVHGIHVILYIIQTICKYIANVEYKDVRI